MGYAHYDTPRGPAGYAVEDTCHDTGCPVRIDRGLGHLCGDQPGYDDEYGCGWWFCGSHLHGGAPGQRMGGQCKACQEAWEREHPPVTVRVTAYDRGRCHLHADGDAEDCACALKVVFQDVVDPQTANGLLDALADRGLIVKLHENDHEPVPDPA